MARMKKHRWFRRTAWVLAFLVTSVVAVWGWAFASVQRSTMARAMVWMEADVGDRFRFPSRPIPAGERVSPLLAGAEIDLAAPLAERGAGAPERFPRANDTPAFGLL